MKTGIGILAKILPTLRRLNANVHTACSHSSAQTTLLPPSWRNKLNNPSNKTILTAEQIEVRVWAAVVIAVTLILFGVVFALLYSVTFVTQPIKSMAPIDQAYTKMLNDIVLLIDGDDKLAPRPDIFTMYNKLFSEGAEFCYGSMISCKEANEFACQRFNPRLGSVMN